MNNHNFFLKVRVLINNIPVINNYIFKTNNKANENSNKQKQTKKSTHNGTR